MSEITKYLKDRSDRMLSEQKEKERTVAELNDAVDALRIVGVEVDENVHRESD